MNAREELKAHLVHDARGRAVTLARRGRWLEAEEELDAWSMLEPQSPEIPLMRARIRYHQGRRHDAMVELDRAAAASGDPATIQRMRAGLLADDERRARRVAQKKADREARRAFVGDAISRIGEFAADLSPREVVYFAACVVFVGYVLFLAPSV